MTISEKHIRRIAFVSLLFIVAARVYEARELFQPEPYAGLRGLQKGIEETTDAIFLFYAGILFFVSFYVLLGQKWANITALAMLGLTICVHLVGFFAYDQFNQVFLFLSALATLAVYVAHNKSKLTA